MLEDRLTDPPALAEGPAGSLRGPWRGAPGRVGPRLRPEHATLGLAVTSVDALFLQASRQVTLRMRDADKLIASRLMRRHARRSTALGGGIALPHAEITHLGAPLLLYQRLARPLPMDAPDGQPVRHVFVLLVPKPANSEDHRSLAELSHLLGQPGLASALDRASTPVAVCHLLAHLDSEP